VTDESVMNKNISNFEHIQQKVCCEFKEYYSLSSKCFSWRI